MTRNFDRKVHVLRSCLYRACRLTGILVVILMATARPGAGQMPSSPPLTLTDAIRTALRENPRIGAASAQQDAAKARITEAYSGFVPQLNFSEAYSHTNNPMWSFGTKLNQEIIDRQDFNPDTLNNPDPVNNFASVLSVNWSVYDSGRTHYGVRQARLSREAVVLMTERTRQQIIAETVTAYAGLLLAQRSLSVIEQTLDTARSHLKMVRARYDSGFVVKSDLLRAQVHIAALEQQRLQAESGVQVARALLNSVMGISLASRFEPVSRLEIDDGVAGSLEEWSAAALAHRPDLKQVQLQESIAREEITKSRSARLPSLNLMGNYEFNTGDFNAWGDNYTLGAVMRVNIFSGRRIASKIIQAKAALEQVAAQQRHLSQGILLQTRQAFFEAQSAFQRIRVTRAAVDQAEENLRIVRNRYDSGLFTIVALLDAELALQQAMTNRFRSIHDYKVAAVQLALAAGTIDEHIH